MNHRISTLSIMRYIPWRLAEPFFQGSTTGSVSHCDMFDSDGETLGVARCRHEIIKGIRKNPRITRLLCWLIPLCSNNLSAHSLAMLYRSCGIS